MPQPTVDTECTFPGCTRRRIPAPTGGGRPSTYCDDPGHNAVTAFRARRAATGDPVDEAGGLRPASLAGMRLRSVAEQVRDELAGHRTRLEDLLEAALESFAEAGDPAAVEAELASMRAEMLRTIGDGDAALAAERRDRAAAEDRANQADQRREIAEAVADQARREADEARTEATQARQTAAEHQALAASAMASEGAAIAARELAEEAAHRARAEQTRAEREATTAVEAGARAEAAREQAEARSTQSAADARAANDRAEAATAEAAGAAAEAADARRRAEVLEQRVRDAERLRAIADERSADYRAQLEEYRQREVARSEETRDRVAELHARIDELTLSRQREADRADAAEKKLSERPKTRTATVDRTKPK